MEYVVKVGRKGQVVIPEEVRRALGIRDKVIVRLEDGVAKIIPLIPLEELFGVDSEAGREIAKEIVLERREELKRKARPRVLC